MKKLFSLFAAAVMAVSMMAATTFTYSSSVDAQTKDGFTVTLAQGTGQNEPKAVNNYDTKVDEVRLYLGNTITVSGASITGVELTFTKQGAKDYATLSADGGNLVSGGTSTSNNDPKTDVWTGSATSVTFELGTKGQRILTKVVVYGEGGDTPTPPTPPTPSGDVTITGLNYADAIFYADETYGDYWAFDFYKELDEEGHILSPYVYFICEESTTSGTKIAGTWTAYDAGYFATDDEESGIYTDEEVPVGSLTVTCVSQGVYNFVGSFVGEDGKTYTWTLNNMEVYAYNGDTDEDITLTDGGTPTPPTPVSGITAAEAYEIGNALEEGKSTSTEYTVIAYAGTTYDYNTQYKNQDFYLTDEKGAYSNFFCKRTTVDTPVAKDDYLAVTGKIEKNVYNNKTTIQIYQGKAKHISPTALAEIMQNVKVKKMLMKGQVIILKGTQLFDLSGRVIE